MAIAGVLTIFILLMTTAGFVFLHRDTPPAAELADLIPAVVASTPVIVPASLPAAPATLPAVQPHAADAPPKPYDIVLDASQLDQLPPDAINRLAADLPATVIDSHPVHAISGGNMTVEMSAPHRHATHARIDPDRDKAMFQAGIAATLLAEGEIDQALRAQHKASELAPHDLTLRLQLAIIYDRAGDEAGAAMLYKQILDGYDKHVADLPPDTDIASIRQRLAYLSSR